MQSSGGGGAGIVARIDVSAARRRASGRRATRRRASGRRATRRRASGRRARAGGSSAGRRGRRSTRAGGRLTGVGAARGWGPRRLGDRGCRRRRQRRRGRGENRRGWVEAWRIAVEATGMPWLRPLFCPHSTRLACPATRHVRGMQTPRRCGRESGAQGRGGRSVAPCARRYILAIGFSPSIWRTSRQAARPAATLPCDTSTSPSCSLAGKKPGLCASACSSSVLAFVQPSEHLQVLGEAMSQIGEGGRERHGALELEHGVADEAKIGVGLRDLGVHVGELAAGRRARALWLR